MELTGYPYTEDTATADANESSAVVPYFPSLAYYRRWMRLRVAEALDDVQARTRLLADTPRGERRRMARTLIAGAHRQPPLTLSLPVEGGGGMLRKGEAGRWRISMHGRWPAVHLGALEAAYGATPFYAHLRPELERILRDADAGQPFADFTLRLHTLCLGLLDTEGLLSELRRINAVEPGRLRRLAEEKSAGIHTDRAFIDVIFRKGREALFTLLLNDDDNNASTY
ncbi:MAG: WbqC family protein [Muribaculaceae bacterium]|nr:WbqC family protein [Muribaculaceae bacterium]MDE7081335.1 WbqC family protein [Muribaculaceae bacterium]